MTDVVALGELLIDFAAKATDAAGYPTMAANPGGAPGNFLAALNAYGRRTAFLGKVGQDAFGRLLLNTLAQAGIETKGIVVDDSVFTTLAFVTFDAQGDRSFSFARKPGADTQLRWEEIDTALIDDARVFHFGTLSLTDEPARTATQKAIAYAKGKGIYEMERERVESAVTNERRAQVGTGMRNERIRTYNFPQNRVTDHRLTGDNKNFNIDAVINGDLDPIIDALTMQAQAEKLRESTES